MAKSRRPEYSDVLIIGAGISGIGAAYRIHEKNPKLSYTVLERRERIGGTWDLFRYPGIRSDSDIFTLSFPFEPWTRPENVADGPDIREYLTADRAQARHRRAHPLQYPRRVRRLGFGHRHLDGADGVDGEPKTYRGRFLFFGTGYYNYDEPYSAGVSRHRRVQGRGGAPAVLAGVAGLHRQEGRGDRQRRYGGQPDPVADREGRPRDDAAAVADLLAVRRRGSTRSCRRFRKVLPFRPLISAARWFNGGFYGLIYWIARKAPNSAGTCPQSGETQSARGLSR